MSSAYVEEILNSMIRWKNSRVEAKTDLIFRCDEHAGAWLVANLTRLGSCICYFSMSIDVWKGSHLELLCRTSERYSDDRLMRISLNKKG